MSFDSFLKFVASHLKSDWTVDDYPVRLREQADVPAEARFVAQIEHWPVATGIGHTPEEARQALAAFVERYRTEKGSLPRPGTEVPISYASTDGIDRNRDIAETFLGAVLGFGPNDPVFISDGSSLSDFDGLLPRGSIHDRIQEVFGVDVRDLESDRLVDVFDHIRRHR